MRRDWAHRGEGNLGCILWTLLLLVAILIAWKAIPVKVQSAELYDFMVEQARFAGNRHPENIEKAILQKALELDLPLEKKNLQVVRLGDRIRMKATFTVPVKFPGYTYMWNFDYEIDRPVYIM